ncbi:MAG TPA: exodeoxyribonuclease III [Candidatus Paceibacterota bacterium]|nr:exodeoxyribonuclease III [Candidatus Paceibacterota bacterium]
MKIISWNVNGIRAVHRKGAFLPFVKKTDPDILCLQETKADESQLSEEIKNIPGFHVTFSSSMDKKGYSGVAMYSKTKPEKIETQIGSPELDREGRVIAAYFKDFVLLNVYFPNGGGGPIRLKYKLDFYDAFLTLVERLRREGRAIIFCGDVNTAHEEIDLARPKENEKNTGFLPEERAWLDEVVAAGYIDTFRHFSPLKTGAYSYWDMKTAARERNVGWRIDYFFISNDLLPKLRSADILKNVFGSDHCPIGIEIDLSF